MPAEIEEIDSAVVNKAGKGQIAGQDLACEAAHNNLFTRGRHALADCRMVSGDATKKVQKG
jgi:hypothetical protein